MWSKSIGVAVGLTALTLGTSAAHAHSLGAARETLYSRGYYDVRVERASLPYSFNACKRGVRYHIHMNWYGDLVQVDPFGQCNGYGNRPRYDDGGSYDNRYRYRRDDY